MPIELGDSKLTSATEVAKILGVSVSTVKKYVRTGILKGKRMGGELWIAGESIKQVPQEYRNQKRAPKEAVQMLNPPPNDPFTPTTALASPEGSPRPPSRGTEWSWSSLWHFCQEVLIAVSIILCQAFAFVFSYFGAILYLEGKNIYFILGIPVDCALGFALITQLGILSILFSLDRKNALKGLPIYFLLVFLSVFSSHVFAYEESTNSTRLASVKTKAALYLGKAKERLEQNRNALAVEVQKFNGRMEMEDKHGSGQRTGGQGIVWQGLKNKKEILEVKLSQAQENMATFSQLAQTYNEKSFSETDPKALQALVYDLSLQMPAEAITEKTGYETFFKTQGHEDLPHQRAWKALWAKNPSERRQARFTFLYSGIFEFIAFALALYRLSRPVNLPERLEENFTNTVLLLGKVASFRTMSDEAERAADRYSKHRIERTAMRQQNEHEEKTLGHLDRHVKNNNKAKDIVSRKQ